MAELNNETLDLSKRGLKKIEKAPTDESKTIINLILDHNELQKLDNIDTYSRVENLSICNNFLVRMHGVSRLTNIRELSLNNNGLLQIEGLKDLLFIKVLKLAGNHIKSIEHLNHNIHLEYLDLSNNQISFISDISYLKSLKHLNLERNRIIDLRQCDRYLGTNLNHLGLAHNNIQDLNEVSHLVHLNKMESFTVQGNPCVLMAGKDKLGFDYRPFILNWILSVKSIDGFVVSNIEGLKAEWLYSQGKGRSYHTGQHQELCEYLASTCPLTADALETEEQRKLQLILSKAQQHQQQLKDQTNSPLKHKIQSPRMQSRIATRQIGPSPDRLSSSYHSAYTKCSSPSTQMSTSYCGDLNSKQSMSQMSQSYDSPGLMYSLNEKIDKEKHVSAEQITKPVNQSLEAASKMVPVPESLMSPDYQDPIYDIQKTQKTSLSSLSSNSSKDSELNEKRAVNKSIRNSPKLVRSAMSSPKLKVKIERKGSLSSDSDSKKTPNKITNGLSEKNFDQDKLEAVKMASNQRRQKKMSAETVAAVTIQKMWRGYRSRNLNKDTLRILHAIQAARARQHIQRLTCDMEATKAALESERKIQQLQMQAINALWKKVSTIQTADLQKNKNVDTDDNSEVLRQLTDTCFNLQAQVVELQTCMQEVLRAVSNKQVAAPVGTQTDIIAVSTPQEEKCTWLKRPQTLPITMANSVTPTSKKTQFNNETDSLLDDKNAEFESSYEDAHTTATEIEQTEDKELLDA